MLLKSCTRVSATQGKGAPEYEFTVEAAEISENEHSISFPWSPRSLRHGNLRIPGRGRPASPDGYGPSWFEIDTTV